jgi:glyoxylase-like metal-dependent hydrolase (beta-lactamase superfamily II)
MNRRDFLRTGGSAYMALLATHSSPWRTDDEPFFEMRRGVGTFEKRGGTIGWLIRKDAVAIVDAQFPESAGVCLDGVRERSEAPMEYLINTHYHGDHTSGNPVFRDHVKHIVAHENVPTWQWNRARERDLVDPTVADVLFKDELVLDVGDETIHLTYHGPAHTNGDAIVHFVKANVVHMGDLVFNRLPCFIDRDAGARIDGWMSVLEDAHSRFDDETQFIFGHGKSVRGSRADLIRQRDFLGGLLEHAEAAIKSGKTLEEIKETKRLDRFPDYYSDEWKNGIPNALEKAYEELTEDRAPE